MNFIRLFRICSFGWQGFRRNGWLSFIAIINVALTLLMISVALVGSITLNEQRKEVEEELDLTIFLKEEAQEEDILATANRLQERGDVKEVIYVDKEKALAEYIELNKGDEELLAISDEIGSSLARYIRVKPKVADSLKEINDFVLNKYNPIVDETSYEATRESINDFINASKFIIRISIVFSEVLTIVSIIVVLNVIRLAIFSRREEIQVMRIVGASNELIRLPFVIEGLIFGILAALIALLMFWLGAAWLKSQIPLYFPYSEANPLMLFTQYFGELFWSNMLTGILLSTFISYIAVRRYLKL